MRRQVSIVIFALILFHTLSTTSLNFPLKIWKNFNLNENQLSFGHSDYPTVIILPERQGKDYSSTYHYTQDSLLIELKSETDSLTVLSFQGTLVILGIKNKQIVTEYKKLDELQLRIFKEFKETKKEFSDKNLTNSNLNGKHYSGDMDMLVVGPSNINITQQWWESTLAETRLKSQKKLLSWLKKLSIPEDHLKLSQQMLSKTIGMLCKDENHIGLCDLTHFKTKHQRYQIDTRHSFLVIEFLHAEYQRTSLYLFQNMINLLEDRLFYEEDHLPFVPIPQHLGILKLYFEAVKRQGSRLKDLSVRVKAVLNGLINQILLSDVNNLEEQKNYRESNNLHPTLAKMLNMNWKATSAKKEVSSIYQQSFTPDYFYNYPHETADLSVSKIAWLTYATIQFSKLVKEVGDELDRSAIQQPHSLLKVLSNFLRSDPEGEQGRFYSINRVSGGRVYAKQGGYQALLPYAYGVSDIFPQTLFKNITTKYGLTSLNSNHPKYNEHYEYRGNIHTYFNFKILFALKTRLQTQQKKNQNNLKMVTTVISNIKNLILSQWSNNRTSTMWTSQGKTLRNKNQLVVLNLGFLAEN